MLLLLVQLLVLAGIAAGLVLPRLRAGAAAGVAAAGATCAAVAVLDLDAAPRTLEITHRFAAFIGNELGSRDFPVETASAPAWAWAALAAGFCALWAALLWLLRTRPERGAGPAHPFWVPLLLAWSGAAAILGLEKLAAPADLVAPAPLDRALFPATAAAALMLAGRCRSILLSLAWLSLFVATSRLPVALFGTLATRERWGTSLDVHPVVHFANPLVQRTVSVAPGSDEQLAWLIWAPHLLVLPALYMLSCSGLAVARALAARA